MINYIYTNRTPELFDFMVTTLGKSAYPYYKDENLIMFNFITCHWFTNKAEYQINGTLLTQDEFKYFMELKLLGIVITESLVLAYLNQEKKE